MEIDETSVTDIMRLLSGAKVVFEDVNLKGGTIELVIPQPGQLRDVAPQVTSQILSQLGSEINEKNITDIIQLLSGAKVVLEGVELTGGTIELELVSRPRPALVPTIQVISPQQATAIPIPPTEKHLVIPSILQPKKFVPYKEEFTGQITKVQLGATKSEGGTRAYSIMLGGETVPSLYRWDSPPPHKPAVSIDIFDMKIPLARPVREKFADVLEDPAAWAKKAEEYGADAVTIHLISTDPGLEDTSISEAMRTLEDVLQATKVPIIVGGSGNKEKDPQLLAKACEVAEGERILLNSLELDADYKLPAKKALEHDHICLAFSQMDINKAKQLNQALLREGVPPQQIMIDPTTAALGYGTEYSFSIYERIRRAALKGDKTLAMPMSSGSTNGWGAREAHRPESKEPQWGPREYRGPLWEATTAFTLAVVGCDLFMMLHPLSVSLFKQMVDILWADPKGTPPAYADWVTAVL
ncbi:MAG: CO dehydrogenase/acetyl-CoA synthase subunit delta [Candidatus Heimdallarchaeota archaeon]